MDFDLRWLAAVVLSLAIGAGARIFTIPVPAPPRIAGALLVVAMTLGYMLADHLMTEDTIEQSAEK